MSNNYWIWCNRPKTEEDMFIEGPQPGIKENNLEFDNGAFISSVLPEIAIQLGEESEGNLTDHIVAPGTKGLLMTYRLVQALKDNGVDNIQVYPAKLIDNNGSCISADYNVVNIIGCIKAVDLDSSDIEMHPEFPDEIEFINSLVLDKTAIKDQLLFRLSESTQVIVANKRIKNTIEKNNLTGVKFLTPEDYFM